MVIDNTGERHQTGGNLDEFELHNTTTEEKNYRGEAIAKLENVVHHDAVNKEDQVIMLIQVVAIGYLMTRYQKSQDFFFGELSKRFRKQFIPNGGELSHIYNALMVQKDVAKAVEFVEQKMDEWMAVDVVYGTSDQPSA